MLLFKHLMKFSIIIYFRDIFVTKYFLRIYISYRCIILLSYY